MTIIVGYFDRTLTLPRLKMKLTLKQRVEVTSSPKLALEVLEDQGHIDECRK